MNSTIFPTYHKIQSVFRRDDRGRFQLGEWSRDHLGYLANCPWEWTEKVDGTNIRIGIDVAGTYRVGGRTDRAQLPITLLEAIESLQLEGKLRAQIDGPVTLYGEGYGARIQKGGGNYRPDQSFVLFDVQVGHWWLRREDVEDLARKLGLDIVPLRGRGTLYEAIRMAIPGIRSEWGDFQAEGLVCRPEVPLFTRSGQRVIVKVKTTDFDRLTRDGIDLTDWS